MQRTATYIAIAALAALGGTALWLAAFPNVSDAYRAYYLDRSTDCWPAGMPGTLPPDGHVSFTDVANAEAAGLVQECGWTEPEATGAWSIGRDAWLAVKPAGSGPWTVELRMLPYEGDGIPPQRVSIAIKGETVLDLVLKPGDDVTQELRVKPEQLDASGRAVLELSLPDAISPAELGLNLDQRKLAIRLLSLNVSAAAS